MAAKVMRQEVTPRVGIAAPLQRSTGVRGVSVADEQSSFDFNTPATWIEEIYKAIRETTAVHFGEEALACDMGVSRQLLNLRLNRRQDSRGDVQRLHVDALGHLFCDAAARWRFCELVNRMCGAKPPEPISEPTVGEKFQLLLDALEGPAGEAILEVAAKAGGISKAAMRRAR